jgi:hypothetical protein
MSKDLLKNLFINRVNSNMYFCSSNNFMTKRFLFFLIVGIIFGSCSENKRSQGSASITGLAPELARQWIYLNELEVKRLVRIDSVKADEKGTFKFEITLAEPAFFILRTSPENRLSLLLDINEKAEIVCQSKYFIEGVRITGSPGSVLLLDFEKFMIGQKQKIDSLAEVFYAYEDAPDFLSKKLELDSVYSNVMEDQRKYVMDFINEHPGSLASLLVLNRKLGTNKVLDEEEDFIYFHRIDSALTLLYPANKHVADHHNRVEEIRGRKFDRFTADKKLQPGKTAPNIVARDTSNNPVALKTLTGKKVLICFWAGWNAKSRQDNRKLVELYSKLRQNNVEVFGVSLDENEIIWKGAIKLDRLPGIQGCDLKGLSSDVMKDYNLSEQLPYYYIVDEERKIIFRDKDFNKIINRLEEIF